MRSKLTVLGILLFLTAANSMIFVKEKALDDGRTVILQLRPRDPRSLMQGDYMTLAYELASKAEGFPDDKGVSYLTLDSRGVATEASAVAAPGRVPLRYRRSGGQVVFGAESYFFQEGQGKIFEAARYGELRVDEQGMPILTGLLDDRLRPINTH